MFNYIVSRKPAKNRNAACFFFRSILQYCSHVRKSNLLSTAIRRVKLPIKLNIYFITFSNKILLLYVSSHT